MQVVRLDLRDMANSAGVRTGLMEIEDAVVTTTAVEQVDGESDATDVVPAGRKGEIVEAVRLARASSWAESSKYNC